MAAWLRRLITPPVFPGDEENTRIARLLNPILLTLLGALSLIAVAIPLIFPAWFFSTVAAVSILLVLLLARYLMYRGKVRLASQIFLGGLCLAVTLMVLFAGGMTSIDNVYFITLVVICALLLGRRATFVLVISIILVGVVMVVLDAAHAMPPRVFPVPPRSGLLMLSIALILAASTLNLALQYLSEARERSLKELTERKSIESALTESEQRFHAIFDSVNDAIFVHDLNTGAILDVNQRMCEMYGYTREETLQLTIGDLSQGELPFTQENAIAMFKQIPPGGSHLAEWYARDKNDGLFWVEINLRHTIIGGQDRMLVTVRDINERKKAEQRRAALYHISDAAHASQNLEDFYQLIHNVIHTLMPAKNFFIALFETTTDMLSYPYYADEYDQPPPPHKIDRGLTAYVLRTGMPILATPEIFQQLEMDGAVENVGTPSIDWLGAPLRTAHGVIGVLAVQTYTEAERLTLEDQDVLVFISNQVAMLLERKQTEEHDRMVSRGLRAVIEAADELIRCDQLDTLYRRAVELAREKIGVERVGLFLLDPESQLLMGTYGTDIQGHTTDEHAAREPISNHPYLSNLTSDKLWYVRLSTQAYWEGKTAFPLQEGWIASTVIRSVTNPVGVLFNDTAISQTALDETTQETLAVYCSLLGNIIERKRLEAREREMAQRLHAIVDCADELIACENADTLYRRGVELAREKLDVERCSIFLLDDSGETLWGTYGTDHKRQTTDEHGDSWQARIRPEIFSGGGQNRLIHVEDQHTYWENGVRVILDRGWVAFTLIRVADQPIGVFCNDTAITHNLPDDTIQETIAIFCSLLGNIIDRKRFEERQRDMVNRLHTVVDCADELIACEDLNTFYRRAVELAREKLDVERCGIFLLDETGEYMIGTYGTDDKGQTTDEHKARWAEKERPELRAGKDQSHMFRLIDRHTYWKDNRKITLEEGWVCFTLIRIGEEMIGVFCNDTAISHTPPDDAVQETIAIYCSLLGNIIDRKRSEEHERDMVLRLHAVVDAADVLIGCESLDSLYRRAVELARERLNVERCSLYLLDENHVNFQGTYGTTAEFQTSDEHSIKFEAFGVPEMDDRSGIKYVVHENVYPVSIENGVQRPLKQGWVASTIIRIADEPIGVLYNDCAISQTPVNETVQETLTIYCSLLGNIIKRMRMEAELKRLIGELENKNSELERFAYTVSHDLKSPLITIRGFLGFLEKDAAAGNIERLRTDIGRITEATNKMQQLLNGLLELSRVGRLMNPGEIVPFEAIARDAIAIVQGQIEAFGAEVILQEGLPSVFGDRARLVEVVQNLLDNAVKFSSQVVDPRIEIGVIGSDEEGKPIFFVRDNGLGIDAQFHERIFGLFNKLDAQSDGTGIGLALVKRIIEFHGGRIWVESEGRGKGSTFFFTLPITDPQTSR